MRPLLAAALSLPSLGVLSQFGARIALRDNFRMTMHHYASVDRPNGNGETRPHVGQRRCGGALARNHLPAAVGAALEADGDAVAVDGRSKRQLRGKRGGGSIETQESRSMARSWFKKK